MTLAQMRAFMKRRMDDALATRWSQAADLNDELNQAMLDLACDEELAAHLWLLHKQETIAISPAAKEYSINAGNDYLLTRKVTRTDLREPVKCARIEPEELENYSHTDGLTDLNGVIYAIGPKADGSMGLLLPTYPMASMTLTHHYMREPAPMVADGDTPDGIRSPFQRLIPLTAAMRLIGADNADSSMYIAIRDEREEKRNQLVNFEGRNYEPEEVEDVTEYG